MVHSLRSLDLLFFSSSAELHHAEAKAFLPTSWLLNSHTGAGEEAEACAEGGGEGGEGNLSRIHSARSPRLGRQKFLS